MVLENPQAAAFVSELERKVQEIKEEFTKSVHSITGTMNGNDGELTFPAFQSRKRKRLIKDSRDYLVKKIVIKILCIDILKSKI